MVKSFFLLPIFFFCTTAFIEEKRFPETLEKPGVSLDAVRTECYRCAECDEITETGFADSSYFEITCMSTTGIERSYTFDSTRICLQYVERHPRLADTLTILQTVADTATLSRHTGAYHWKEIVRRPGKQPFYDVQIDWWLYIDRYSGAELVGMIAEK